MIKETTRHIRHIAAVLALAAAVSCIRDRIPQGADLTLGDRLPEFSVVLDDGTTTGTEDLVGNVSCIMFFHSSCPDCQQAMPRVQKLYENYGGEVKFVCISREEGAETIRAYWQENGFTLPWSAQEGREIYNLFATFAVPRIYISDADGIIRAIFTDSPVPTYEDMETAVLDLLQE